MSTRHARAIAATAGTLPVLVLLTACHGPSGAWMPYTGASQSYISTEHLPKSVRIVDTRSGDIVFAMDVPSGKQLSLDFVAGQGDDPVYTPDLMRWQLFEAGTRTGSLRSSMSVPGATARRIDVDVRPGPEYPPASPDDPLRADRPGDRPDWWTPQGGERPADLTGRRRYDR
ncbi:MAG: hypothetical protein KF817_16140 [Phycisphaeraceae bacterium]|nr:hypothetical protein [Phycisphaeraceae bacterium]